LKIHENIGLANLRGLELMASDIINQSGAYSLSDNLLPWQPIIQSPESSNITSVHFVFVRVF
jgi:hypothetical protein